MMVKAPVDYYYCSKNYGVNKEAHQGSPKQRGAPTIRTDTYVQTTEIDAVCYLCNDGEVDDNAGQPLRRDCACRGTDAGFVHLSCLTGYAAAKSKQARDTNEFFNPRQICPGCQKDYQNELFIDIANKFVPFVRRQYPDDTRRQVESLHVRLRAFNNMLGRLQPVLKIEAGDAANVLLSMIDRMKNDAPLTGRYSSFAAYAHNVHGLIALLEGTEESARRAVTHFEKFLEVSEEVGYVEGIAVAKGSIAIAKSKYEGSNSDEEVLKASRDVYELRIAQLGEESEQTIRAGKNYAIGLQNANRGDEARDLITKLLATSKQVLGPHHSTTKEVENTIN